MARFGNLKIIKLPQEAVSAFEPYKRPVFTDMVARIKKGEAQGIIAWHPDRLSRNPIDAAALIYLLDKGELKDLKFCSYGFDNSPEGKMMLSMTLSQSKYSSDKLSKDVKRGIDRKSAGGWRSGRAPVGYLNSKTKLKGEQDISSDPERFQIVKQTLQTMLTGLYSAPQVFEIAVKQYGLTLPPSGKKQARKPHMSALYRLLTNPFYYGWYEWPQGSGNWVHGKHEPMITEEEFDRIQFLLGRQGRPRPKSHKFAFTGLMKCPCGASITAEEKFKHQKNGNVHHYIFYHCTRHVDRNCVERSIEIKELSRQIDERLKNITISEKFQKWAIAYLHEIRKDEAVTQEKTLEAKQNQLARVVKSLDSLVLNYTSSANADRQFLTDQEYLTAKSGLLKEKAGLESELNVQGKKIEEWVELTERTFNFARYARTWFAQGDLDTKRAIFACIGSDLILKNREVSLTLNKPFKFIFDRLPAAEKELGRLEPLKFGSMKGRSEVFASKFPIVSG